MCKKADNPSIITNIAIVNTDQVPKVKYNKIEPLYDSLINPAFKTIFHKTSESSKTKYNYFNNHISINGFIHFTRKRNAIILKYFHYVLFFIVNTNLSFYGLSNQ